MIIKNKQTNTASSPKFLCSLSFTLIILKQESFKDFSFSEVLRFIFWNNTLYWGEWPQTMEGFIQLTVQIRTSLQVKGAGHNNKTRWPAINWDGPRSASIYSRLLLGQHTDVKSGFAGSIAPCQLLCFCHDLVASTWDSDLHHHSLCFSSGLLEFPLPTITGISGEWELCPLNAPECGMGWEFLPLLWDLGRRCTSGTLNSNFDYGFSWQTKITMRFQAHKGLNGCLWTGLGMR